MSNFNEPDKSLEYLKSGYDANNPEPKTYKEPTLYETPEINGAELPLLVRLAKGFSKLKREQGE